MYNKSLRGDATKGNIIYPFFYYLGLASYATWGMAHHVAVPGGGQQHPPPSIVTVATQVRSYSCRYTASNPIYFRWLKTRSKAKEGTLPLDCKLQ